MNETGADDSDWVYSSCGDQADNDGGPWLQWSQHGQGGA
jgi:hypothetical protein